MLDGGVVPHQQVADRPAVPVDEAVLHDQVGEPVDQRERFRVVHAVYADALALADVKRLAAGLRVRAGDRMAGVGVPVDLRLGHGDRLFHAAFLGGEAVDRLQALDAAAGFPVERVIGRRGACEERGAQRLARIVVRHLQGVEQGPARRLRRVGHVRVPVAAGVGIAERPAAPVPQVRHLEHFRHAFERMLVEGVDLDLPEAAGEGQQLVRRQRLAPETEHAVAVERRLARLEHLIGQRRRQVHAEHVRPHRRAARTDFETGVVGSHRKPPETVRRYSPRNRPACKLPASMRRSSSAATRGTSFTGS